MLIHLLFLAGLIELANAFGADLRPPTSDLWFLAQSSMDPVALVDKASQQTDRWLFLALLVVILAGAVAIIRYLLKERAQHLEWMKTVYTENIKLTAQVLIALQENNTLLRRLDQHLLKTEDHP